MYAVGLTIGRDIPRSAPLTAEALAERSERRVKIYAMHVAGEMSEGRQATIRSLGVGQRLHLRREPHNSYDRNAVAIETMDGKMVGYLSRHNASWVSRILDEGIDLQANVACLCYGDADGNGIELQINIDGVPPKGYDGWRAQVHGETTLETGRAVWSNPAASLPGG